MGFRSAKEGTDLVPTDLKVPDGLTARAAQIYLIEKGVEVKTVGSTCDSKVQLGSGYGKYTQRNLDAKLNVLKVMVLNNYNGRDGIIACMRTVQCD